MPNVWDQLKAAWRRWLWRLVKLLHRRSAAVYAILIAADSAKTNRIERTAGSFFLGVDQSRRRLIDLSVTLRGPKTISPSRGMTALRGLTKGFWLGKTEVTQAQYQASTGTNPSTLTAVGPDAPVERASWIDAMEFCRKLNERERAAGRLPAGYSFSLPTEAQWEYSGRAGTTGDYAGDPETMMWHAKNSGGTTHPVAQKKANAWGFFDMTGNVLEWCYDWYGPYPEAP